MVHRWYNGPGSDRYRTTPWCLATLYAGGGKYLDSAITSGNFTSSGDPTIWSRKEADGGATSTIFGVTDGLTVFNNIATGVTIPHSLEIILDTTPATWTAEFKVNGSGLAPIAFTAPNPTINHVGFHIRPQSTMQVDNFKLSVVPEPGAMLIFALGLAGPLVYVRRKWR